jgi:protein-tyrosine sulfotransferase
VQTDSDRGEWPAFIVGCHRSGSTLLRYILDAHPRLACPPESKFICGIDACLGYSQVLPALHSLGCDSLRIFDGLKRLIEEVLGGFARAQGKSRWIDKTPNYYRLLPLINAIFQEHVLFIFLCRHPLDSIGSLEDSPCFRPPAIADPDVARALERYGHGREGYAHYWREVNRTIVEFLPTAPGRTLTVRYEDLVSSPEPTTKSILDFLGESMDPELLERAFARTPVHGFQDWKIRQTTAVHDLSVGRFREWTSDEIETSWALVEPVATVLGYPPPLVSGGES